jgi:hypothetical protein
MKISEIYDGFDGYKEHVTTDCMRMSNIDKQIKQIEETETRLTTLKKYNAEMNIAIRNGIPIVFEVYNKQPEDITTIVITKSREMPMIGITFGYRLAEILIKNMKVEVGEPIDEKELYAKQYEKAKTMNPQTAFGIVIREIEREVRSANLHLEWLRCEAM